MTYPVNGSYRFSTFEVDPRSAQLRFRGEPVSISPKAFAVLCLLVSRRGELVSKEDLVEIVWDGAAIHESNITKYIAEIRRILKRGLAAVDPVATVWRVGYRFTIEVEFTPDVQELEVQELDVKSLDLDEPSPAALPPVPSTLGSGHSVWRLRIGVALACLLVVASVGAYFLYGKGRSSTRRSTLAVMSFRDTDSKVENAWLGSALREALSDELQNNPSVRVLPAAEIAQAYSELGIKPGKGDQESELRQLAAKLGCRYAVIGEYIVLGPTLRLNFTLKDMETGGSTPIASRTGPLDHVFEMMVLSGADLRRTLGEDKVRARTLPAGSPSTEAIQLHSLGLVKLRAWDTAGASALLTEAAEKAPGYAPIHSALALNWMLMGYDERAKAEAKRAMESSAGLSRESQLQIEAGYADAIGDWKKAAETWAALRSFYPDNPDYIERLGNTEIARGKPAQAIEAIRTFGPLAGGATDPRLLIVQAKAESALSSYAASAETAAVAVERAREKSSRNLESVALRTRAAALFRLSRFDEATVAYAESARISAATGNRLGVADALAGAAEVLASQKQRPAEAEFTKALEISREIGNRAGQIRAWSGISRTRRMLADIPGARAAAREALALARETGNGIEELNSRNDIANFTNNLGDPDSARIEYRAGLDRAKEIGHKRMTAIFTGNIAVLDYSQGNLQAADEGFQDALRIKREMGDKDSIAYTLTFLARLRHAQGRLQEARGYYSEAEGLLRAIKETVLLPAILGAELAISEGHADLADTQMSEFVIKFPSASPVAQAWRVLGLARLSRGDAAGAQKASDKAVALASGSKNRADFGIPSEILASQVQIVSGDARRAKDRLERLVAESRKLKNVHVEFDARLVLAQAEEKLGNKLGARETARALEKDASRLGFENVRNRLRQIPSFRD